MQNDTTRDVLIEARRLIEDEDNWMRGDLKAGNCYCLVGAIAAARGLDLDNMDESDDSYDQTIYDSRNPAIKAVAEEILNSPHNQGMFYHQPASVLWNWNDQARRQHRDVIEVIDKAIAKL